MRRSRRLAGEPAVPRPVLPALQPELIVHVAMLANDAGAICAMEKTCVAWRDALKTSENRRGPLWGSLALSGFPRLKSILAACGGQEEPCYRSLYRSQLLASSIPEFTREGPKFEPSTKISDYVFTVELSCERAGEDVIIWSGEPTLEVDTSSCYRMTTLCAKLFPGRGEAPAWFAKLLPPPALDEHKQVKWFWAHDDEFFDEWCELKLAIFVTHKMHTVRLYDGGVDQRQIGEGEGLVYFGNYWEKELPITPQGSACLYPEARYYLKMWPALRLYYNFIENELEMNFENSCSQDSNSMSRHELMVYLEKGVPWEWSGGTFGVCQDPYEELDYMKHDF